MGSKIIKTLKTGKDAIKLMELTLKEIPKEIHPNGIKAHQEVERYKNKHGKLPN